MGRPQPVNDMLDARLAGLQAHGWSPMLSEAVNAALGVPPGASRDAATTPVIGFYLVEGIVVADDDPDWIITGFEEGRR